MQPWTRNGRSLRRFQTGSWRESQEQEGGFAGSTKRQTESPLWHTNGPMSPQKNAELEPKRQRYKGRVVLPVWHCQRRFRSPRSFYRTGLVCVPDDCCKKSWMLLRDYLVVMDRQHMRYLPAPKWNGRILPDCSKFPNRNVQMFGYVFHDTNVQKHGKIEDPAVLLGRNLYGHPFAGLLLERQFEEALLELGWEKIPNWECMSVHRKQGLFLSVTVDDFKMAGNKQETAPTWKKFLKKKKKTWILTNSHHFLTLCTLDALSGATLQSFASLFGLSSIQTGGTRVSWRVVRSLLVNCLDMLYLARIGRSDILWSVNKLARSVTKWTRSCDKRLARLISYIHHTNDYRQYCHVANTAQHCRLGLFQDSDFAGDLEDSKSTSDVQDTNFGFAQFYKIWSYFSGCWTTYGWVTCSRSLGHCDWGFKFNERQHSTQTN